MAGLVYGRSYAIITLRPPKKLGATFDIKDITLDGGTIVTVDNGDVGSNANMEYDGGAIRDGDEHRPRLRDVLLGPVGDRRTSLDRRPQPPTPTVQTLPELIEDPNYRYPCMSPSDPGCAGLEHRHRRSLTRPCSGPIGRQRLFAAPMSWPRRSTPPGTRSWPRWTPDEIYCYNPGIYDNGMRPNAEIAVGTGEVASAEPGAYYLRERPQCRDGGAWSADTSRASGRGADVRCDLHASVPVQRRGAKTIALNAGTRFPPEYWAGPLRRAAVDLGRPAGRRPAGRLARRLRCVITLW